MSTNDSFVVYTAITGRYDTLKPLPSTLGPNVMCVAFLDSEPGPIGLWRRSEAHRGFRDPTRNAKIHKILPHRYFPEARYSLWIDGCISILFQHSVERLIETYLAKHDMAIFQHGFRTCLYQEAATCLERNLDDAETIRQQIYRYTRDGYPANNGLWECTVMLRRHSRKVKEFNEMWWEEICKGSRRDQISVNYVAWKLGMTVSYLPGNVYTGENDLFDNSPHAEPRRTLFES